MNRKGLRKCASQIAGHFAAVLMFMLPAVLPGQSTQLVPNQSTDISISQSGSDAEFTFSGNAGETHSFWVTSSTFNGCPSLSITIYNPDGSILASNGRCGVGSLGVGTFILRQSGLHKIIITPGGGATGTATVTLASDQTITGLDPSGPLTFASSVTGQNIRLPFNAVAGDEVNIALTNSTFTGCASVTLEVFDPNGAPVSNINLCGSADAALSIPSVSQTGTYTLLILPGDGGTGSGTLTLSHDQTGQLLVPTDPSVVTIGIRGQNARLTFDGVAGQEMNVALRNSGFGGCLAVTLTILAPDGSQLASTSTCFNGNGQISLPDLPQTGSYTALVTPGYANTGAVTLYLSSDRVTSVDPGVPTSVTSITPGQRLQLIFPGSAGQQGFVSVTAPTFDGCLSYSLVLLNPDGSTVSNAATCFSSPLSLPSLTLTQTGTYSVLIVPGDGQTGSATVTVAIAAPAAIPTFSPPSGTFTDAPTVSIVAGPNSSIFYTTDGTVPSSHSNQYASPIPITKSQKLQAISVAANATTSSVGEATYVLAVPPTLSLLSPRSIIAGGSLILSGANLGLAQGGSSVTLSGVALPVTAWNDSEVHLRLPANAVSGPMFVTTAYGISNVLDLTVIPLASGYVRSIMIDHTQVAGSDQQNFPVLMSGIYPFLASVANGGRSTSAQEFDVVFSSDAAGQNLLDYEIDNYDATTGRAAFWVRVPVLSHSSDTTLYLWYGLNGITDTQENKAGVWSNGFGGVWHFGTSTQGINSDSTDNANHATNNGVTSSLGNVGSAGTFDGTGNTFFDIPSAASLKPSTTLTLEAWVRMTSGTFFPDIFSLDYHADGNWGFPYQVYALDFLQGGLAPRIEVTVPSGTPNSLSAPTEIAANQWNHLVGTYDGTTFVLYSNGVQVSSAPQTGTIDYGTSKDLDIGSRSPYSTGEAINGLIDEARLSTVARSANWVATEYSNQSTPNLFLTVGSEGSGTGQAIPVIHQVNPNPAPPGSQIVITGLDFGPSQGSSVVTLNGLPLTTSQWSDSSISAPLPSDAHSGPVVISTGTVFSAPVNLAVQVAPTLSSLSPGSVLVGGTLIVSGTSFGLAQEGSSVNLSGVVLPVTTWSDSEVRLRLPLTATSGTLTLTTAAGTSNPLNLTVVPAAAGYVRSITIDHTQVAGSDQTDFPVLITGTYPFLANVANGGRSMNDHGFDIAFSSDPAGTTLLDYEIDNYDANTGRAGLWIRVPVLSHSSDTTIYLWYGINGISESQENKSGVWSNGYGGVWHFGTHTQDLTLDSTGNANHAKNSGVIAAVGTVGTAGAFDGTGNTFFDIPSAPSLKPATTLTLEAWVKMTSGTSFPDIFSLDYHADGNWAYPYQSYALDFWLGGLAPRIDVAVLGGTQTSVTAPSEIATDQWNHVVGTYDGANFILYSNGIPVLTAPQSGSIDYGTSRDLDIGSRSPYNTGEAVNGLIDEARVSNVTRSADWIATEYANQSMPNLFATLGSEGTSRQTKPFIGQVSPNPAQAGSQVAVTGSGFGANQGSSTVTLGGLPLPITLWSEDALNITIPQASTTGAVVVSVGGNSSIPVALRIQPTTWAITWPTPAPISFGTALGTLQENASTTIPGTFEYSPAEGTILPVGTSQLAVSFIPFDNAYLPSQSATVQLIITPPVPASAPSPGMLSTVAGNGFVGWSGDGGVATGAELNRPAAVTIDREGNVFIADTNNHVIRKLTAVTNIITTIVGNNVAGYSGDGGPAISASLNQPRGLGTDSQGNLYIADSGNNVIRRVTQNGIISTVVGDATRTAGYTGDGGESIQAQLNGPTAVTFDDAGVMYVTDRGNSAVRTVSQAGIITTLIGNSDGTPGYTGDGGPLSSVKLNKPNSICVSPEGDVYVADSGNNVIRKLTRASNIVSTVAGTSTAGYSGDGGDPLSAQLNNPLGVVIDGKQTLYITDAANGAIRAIVNTSMARQITTIAGGGHPGYYGDGGLAQGAGLNAPSGLAIDIAGNVVFADTANSVIRAVGIPVNGGGVYQGDAVSFYQVNPYALGSSEANTEGTNIDPSAIPLAGTDAQAFGIVGDGTAASILVYTTNRPGAVTLSTDPMTGGLLYHWYGGFLNNSPLSVPNTTLQLTATDFHPSQDGKFTALALLQAPAPSSAAGLPAAITVTASDGVLPIATTSIRVIPRPVLFLHGIWSDSDAFVQTAKYVMQKGKYIDITGAPSAGQCTDKASACLQPLWSPIIRACYSPQLAFDAPSGYSIDCNGASVDIVALNLQRIYDYLDIEQVVGGRVDVIAHSMGGLVARHFPVALDGDLPYFGIRDRGFGKFYSLLTIDTPELGSALADTLIADANLSPHFTSSTPADARVVWSAAGCRDSDTLASCYARIHKPLSYDEDAPYYTHGSAYSLQTDYPGIFDAKANPLMIPNVIHGAISAVVDQSSYIYLGHPRSLARPSANAITCKEGVCTSGPANPSILMASVQGFLDAVSPFPVTVSGLLQGPSDGIVSALSQQAGTNGGTPIPGLAHSGLGWFKAAALGILLDGDQLSSTIYSDENVMSSPMINSIVVCWLVGTSHCPVVASADGSDSSLKAVQLVTSTPPVLSHRNAGVMPFSDPPAGKASLGEVLEQSARTTKEPITDASDRVQITAPTTSVILGDSIHLGIIIRGANPSFLSVRQETTGTTETDRDVVSGSEENASLLRGSGGETFIPVIPLRLGSVHIIVTAVFAGGGLTAQDIPISVLPPLAPPLKFWLSGGTVVLGLHRHTFHIQPYAEYVGLKTSISVNTRFVHFSVTSSGGREVIRLDEDSGLVTPVSIGNALVKATFAGETSLTCVIVKDSAVVKEGRHSNCEELLAPGEALPYLRHQVIGR